MKLLTCCIPALAGLLLVSTAQAATQCTLGELTRTVEVVYSETGQSVPCEVRYDKRSEGVQETPWSAQNQAGFCEDRAEELVARLRSNGWQCAALARTLPASATPAGEALGSSEEAASEEAETEQPAAEGAADTLDD